MDLSGRRLRLLIPDILGLERGKYLFGDVAEAGHAAFCIGFVPPSQFGGGSVFIYVLIHSPRTGRSCRPHGSSSTSASPTSKPSWTGTPCGRAGRTTPWSASPT